jgi:transposase
MVRAERKQDRRVKKFQSALDGWETGRLSQLEAAEVLGCSERQFRRYVGRYEADGEAGLKDKRLGRAQAKAIPVDEVERMLTLYRTTYRGWNVSHFHEHGRRNHNFNWGYTWTKTHLHASGLVVTSKTHGPHRRKRECKPLTGMMLHQDGSKHAWLDGQPDMDLIVTMDDATSTIYSAFQIDEAYSATIRMRRGG